MGRFGQALRGVRKVLFVTLMCVALYLFAAIFGAVPVGASKSASTLPKEVRVGLLQGPIHYDFLLPLNAETREAFSWLQDQGFELAHPNAEWLIIGWGAKAFYTQTGTFADMSAGSVLKAIFGDHSVMRVDLAGGLNTDAPVRWLDLDQRQFKALQAQIIDSFAQGANSTPMAIEGFNGFDMFFPAKGRFHLFRTCNVWLGRTLRQAGVAFGRWTPTPFAVTLSLRLRQP